MTFAPTRTEAHVSVARPAALVRSGELANFVAILSPAERARMQRFHFERDCLAYAAAHGLVRMALSARAPSVAPEAWQFRTTEHGRPEVAAPHCTPALRFNLSHTHGLVACVIADEIDCGIDVERFDRDTDIHRLAATVLAPSEHAALLAVPPAAQQARFFAYWTLKEAYVKALGRGLAIPLAQCAFALDSNGQVGGFTAPPGDDAREWQFARWASTESHLLAIALRCGRRPASRYTVMLNSEQRGDCGAGST